MARRAPIIKRKEKPIRVSRSEQYLVNLKYLGDEPVFTAPLTELQYISALSWYNAMCDINDAREYIETYLKNTNRHSDAKKLKKVADCWVSTTAAWICRMISKGYKLPENAQKFCAQKITESLKKAVKEEPKSEVIAPVISIQDRMRERQSDIIAEVEIMIDSGEQFSLYDWLKTNEIPSQYSSGIANKYRPWLMELIEAYEGKDLQLKEAYAHLSKKQLKERIMFFNTLIEDAERYGQVNKKTRAPRKPRPVSMEKKLKNLKYQKEDKIFKIASINPEKIIGAQELWTFNTKYKILTVFRALDRSGLQVKGTTIIGYDEKTSQSKGCGRKPEPIIDKVQNGGKIVLRKIMDELKTDKALQHRVNENTILLRVI
jgi:hypothetical protein